MEQSTRLSPAYAARLVDWSMTALLVAILVSWMTGGIDIEVGSLRFQLYVAHSYGALLQLLFAMVMIRWLLQIQWIDRPFILFPGWKVFFKRLLEFAIVVRIAMALLAMVYGDVQLPMLRTLSPEQSFSVIYLMILFRLLLSRWFGAVTLMISVPISIAAVLYGTEIILTTSDSQQLRTHYAGIYTEDAARGEYPITVPDDYNPSINQGLQWTWGHEVVSNSLGFREKEFAVPKPAGVFRVMVLGDSLTWGAGLSVRERYTDRLSYLVGLHNTGRRIEILNFGMPGGPTVTEYAHLKELHADVDPDLIIVGFCINDSQPRSQTYSIERSRLDTLYESIAKLRHIGLNKTYAFIISGIDNLLMGLGLLPSWHDALNRAYDPDSAEWKGFDRALAGIKEISDRQGLPQPIFIPLTQGIAGNHSQHIYIKEWFGKAVDAAASKGFLVVDPMPRFLEEMGIAEMAVNPLDGHPSAKANEIYAEELVQPVLQAALNRSAAAR
jgi:lysophospholipase L1-like esterase